MLKSAGAANVCMGYASSIANAAGDGYKAEARKYPERTGAAVYPETPKAIRDNLKNNTLLRAMP